MGLQRQARATAQAATWLAVAVAVLAAVAAGPSSGLATSEAVDYKKLKPETWTQFHLNAGETSFFSLTNSNPGEACSGPCDEGNRWVKVAAHSQALTIQLTLGVKEDVLTPDGLCASNSTESCFTVQSTGASAVTRLGTWSKQPDDECYVQGSTWTPFPGNPKMHIAVTLLPASSSSAPAHLAHGGAVALFAELADGSRPMPGGCATQGLREFDDMISIEYSRTQTVVDYQQADLGSPISANFPKDVSVSSCTCDYIAEQAETPPGTLKYELYRSYLSNCGSDFHRSFDAGDLLSVLSRMTTAAAVKKYGTRVDDAVVLPNQLRRKSIDSKPGQVRFAVFGGGSESGGSGTSPVVAAAACCCCCCCGCLLLRLLVFGTVSLVMQW